MSGAAGAGGGELAPRSARGIDLNLLHVLAALLEERHVTRAGERAGLSQPAASRALARLRRHFGDQLLVRTGLSSYELTPEARRLLPVVREALQQAGWTLPGAGGFDPGRSTREVSIGISDESAVTLAGLLRRVHQLAPCVRLALHWVPAAAGDGGGFSGHDVVIAPLESGGRAGRPQVICRDRFVCVASPANPRLRGGRLSLQDLAELPRAAVRVPHGGCDPVGAALDRLGVTPRVAVAAGTWVQALFAVRGTDMVAAVPELLACRLAAAAGVTVTEPPFGHVGRAEAAWWHPGHATDPALTWLRGLLAEETRDQTLEPPAGCLPRERGPRDPGGGLQPGLAAAAAGSLPARPARS